MSFEDDFLRGQADCRDGRDSLPQQSEYYYRGYSTEYTKEQVATEMTKNER